MVGIVHPALTLADNGLTEDRMIQFLVTWILVTYVSTSCGGYGPDAYGRTSNVSCAVNHTRKVESQKSKVFDTRKAAELFVENGQKQYGYFNSIYNFKIKEVVK